MATKTTVEDGFWGAAAFGGTAPTFNDHAVIAHKIILPPFASAAICSSIAFTSSNSILGSLGAIGTKSFLRITSATSGRINLEGLTSIERTRTSGTAAIYAPKGTTGS